MQNICLSRYVMASLLLAFLLGCGQGASTTPASSSDDVLSPSASITQDTTWSGEVLISQNTTVNSGVTLTIEPGTTVKFKNYRGYTEDDQRLRLRVEGKLITQGTASQPIYFTSDADDPQNGDWAMVRLFDPSGDSSISYSVFEFAQQGLNVWQSNVTITNSVFRYNNWEGIYFESFVNGSMENCQIYQNGYNGLAAEQFNTITMISCEVWQNGTNGIHVDASTLEVRSSRVHTNNANGLSVDNNGTLKVHGVALYDNQNHIGIGEGTNIVEVSNLRLGTDGNGSLNTEVTEVSSSFTAPDSISLGFSPDSSNALSYTPGNETLDNYSYVYTESDSTRQVIRKIGDSLGLTWSVAWDGTALWTSTLSGDIYKLDPESGAILKQFKAPGSQPWGMTYAEDKLWVVDFAEKSISKINPSTGSTEATYPTPDPIGGCKGVTWDGTHLWVMGWTSAKIYKMDTLGNHLDTVELDQDAGGGIAWDGTHFWVPAGNIYKFTKQGQAVGYIYPASEGTWDLTWDGDYLWATQRTNENWQDEKLFALEILDLKQP